jgi:imidazolonepropionase-like amidohydrolase
MEVGEMKRYGHSLLYFALIVLLTACSGDEARQAESQVLALRGVTIIDGTGAPAQPDMTVVVSGNRITDIGRDVSIPPQAQVVDAPGRFLIPGLWDMHMHIRGAVPGYNSYGDVTLLANGVTGIRVMAGLPEYHRMRDAIEAGEVLGPRMVIASRNLDGLMPNQPRAPMSGDIPAETEEWRAVNAGESIPHAIQITNQAEAREAMIQSKGSGVEFVKIHNGLTREAYFAIAAEAKAQGLYLTGHVPTGISIAELSDSGMRSIEHFAGMLEGCSTREKELLQASLDALSLPQPQRGRRTREIQRMAVESFNAERCAALAAHLVRNNTWLSPTFMPEEGLKAASVRNADLARYLPVALRARWQQDADAAPATPPLSREDQELAELVEKTEREVVTIMKRAGVQFVIGTDGGGRWRFPGFSMQDALMETNKSGLSPMEVLQAATSSSARLLGLDTDLGTVEVGKLADLVLLEADPLQDINNTRRVNAVVINGRVLDRPTLDKMLSDLVASSAQ